jgi:hypothetical protein
MGKQPEGIELALCNGRITVNIGVPKPAPAGADEYVCEVWSSEDRAAQSLFGAGPLGALESAIAYLQGRYGDTDARDG